MTPMTYLIPIHLIQLGFSSHHLTMMTMECQTSHLLTPSSCLRVEEVITMPWRSQPTPIPTLSCMIRCSTSQRRQRRSSLSKRRRTPTNMLTFKKVPQGHNTVTSMHRHPMIRLLMIITVAMTSTLLPKMTTILRLKMTTIHLKTTFTVHHHQVHILRLMMNIIPHQSQPMNQSLIILLNPWVLSSLRRGRMR